MWYLMFHGMDHKVVIINELQIEFIYALSFYCNLDMIYLENFNVTVIPVMNMNEAILCGDEAWSTSVSNVYL